jgi:ABC-type nitrate/sulfonate/bicarbonate transport system permease component
MTEEINPYKPPLSKRILEAYLPPIIFLIFILGGWEILVSVFQIPRWLLPAPSGIFRQFFKSPDLWLHTRLTLTEAFLGFSASAVSGILVAMLIAHIRFLEKGVFPYLVVANSIPIVAIAPLLTIWFGFGLTPKVLIAMIITFFPIVTNTTRGLKAADYRIIEMMYSINASTWQIIRKIELPTALPYIFSAFKISLSLSLIGAVVAEFYGADHGLGYLVIYSATQLETELLFVAISILAATGVSVFLVFTWVESRFASWKA